tara:strand:+ start:206 stop:436 length:231 start_codon:yes stop_codon:yes gene_type:complete
MMTRILGRTPYAVFKKGLGEYTYVGKVLDYEVRVGPASCTCTAFKGEDQTVANRRCVHVEDASLVFLDELNRMEMK